MATINRAGQCQGCGFRGLTLERGLVSACPVCAVEFIEALIRLAKTPRSHAAILAGQQFLLRGGVSLAEALRGLRGRLPDA